MQILRDFNKIFCRRLLPLGHNDISNYGNDSLKRVIDYFTSQPNTLIDSQQTRRNFSPFKFFINVNRELDLQALYLKLMSEYTENFPNFCTLAAILMTVPLTSVPCERGFSFQNNHINASTNSRNSVNVESRMHISYQSKIDCYDEQTAVQEAVRKFLKLNLNRQF